MRQNSQHTQAQRQVQISQQKISHCGWKPASLMRERMVTQSRWMAALLMAAKALSFSSRVATSRLAARTSLTASARRMRSGEQTTSHTLR